MADEQQRHLTYGDAVRREVALNRLRRYWLRRRGLRRIIASKYP